MPTYAGLDERVDRDTAVLGGRLAFYLVQGAKLFANYDLLISANDTAHAGTGGLKSVRQLRIRR